MTHLKKQFKPQFIAILILTISAFIVLTPNQTLATEKGNCYCVIAENPPKEGACFDSIDNTTCKAKEDTDLKGCYLATGQTGKCTEADNKDFLKKNGECTCAGIPGGSDKPATDQTPTNCASIQANAKKDHPAEKDKIKCTWTEKTTSTGGGSNASPPKQEIIPIQSPVLSIPIPGLKFSEIKQEEGDKEIGVPWLAEYMTATYSYLVGVGIIIGVILLMIGGIQWMTAGGSGRVAQAKEKLQRATMGLGLILGSYIILHTINPDILSLQKLGIQVVHRDPMEFQDVTPGTGDGAAGSGGGPTGVGGSPAAGSKASIGALLNNYKSPHPPCSSEAAQDVAQKLHEMKICVGPCHCAYTATRFLSYIGCGNALNGSANRGASMLERKGWVTTRITDSNIENLRVGMLWFPGHVGVSTGKGKMFESGTGSIFTRTARGGACPGTYDKAIGTNLCDYCAKLKGEGPQSGNYGANGVAGGKRGAPSCKKNQGWTVSGKRRIKQFRAVIHPKPAGTTAPALGCCNIKGRMITSKILCEELATKRSATGKITEQKKWTWVQGTTNPAECKGPAQHN